MILNRAARCGTAAVTATLSAVALLAVTACAGTTEPTATVPPVSSAATPTAATPTQTPTNPPATEEPDTVTTIRITVADQTITAELTDNPTARDLAQQLPLTLRFRDFNRVEKIAELPRPLTMGGVPAGDDPEINDIGYYAPSRNLVFYYGDVGYFNGIVRIGRFHNADIDLIQRQPDEFEVTIEQA
jgi:hypothetical protein